MTIRQFDVFQNPLREARRVYPYVVCVQHDVHAHLATRVVVPLAVKLDEQEPPRLHPSISIAGARLYFDPAAVIALPARLLAVPVTNLSAERERLIAALDLVFTGV